jgi:Zn-dependent peptidase ImmA (M78 family)
MRADFRPDADLREELDRLARRFKVSVLVVLRRIHDLCAISQKELWEIYRKELERLASIAKGAGGDFYLTQSARAGKRFSRALVANVFEGQTSFTEAFRLLGVKKPETLRRFGAELGVKI